MSANAARTIIPDGPRFSEPDWVISYILEAEFRILEAEFRPQPVVQLCRTLQSTAPFAQQPCARHFFGNCPIQVDSLFCRAHPYTDKSRRYDSRSTLEGRTTLGFRLATWWFRAQSIIRCAWFFLQRKKRILVTTVTETQATLA